MTSLINKWDSTTELDFEKHWSCIDVQHEVLRGIELRERKPQSNASHYNFINIPLPTRCKSSETSPKRRRSRKVTKKTRLKQNGKERQCPLRVIELAEPSKRHCLNTWKNNYKTLPDYMVDRLRRHVMNEKPVVRISEAVNYFKNKKSSKRRLTPVACTTVKNCKPKSNKKQDFTMTLCSIFAYKVSQKLITPVNTAVNEELANITRVVAYEMHNILQGKIKPANTLKNYKILIEMAQKVTIWITDILEETSYRLLLEQLEELEEEEGPVLDILDDILQSVEIQCKTSSSSDSVLSEANNSTHVSISTKNTEDGEGAIEDISDEKIERTGAVGNSDKDTILYENDYGDDINEQFALKEHLKSLLDERINYILNNNNVNKDYSNIINDDEKTDFFTESSNNKNASDFNSATEYKTNEIPRFSEDNTFYTGTEDIISEPDEKINLTSNNSSSTEGDITKQNDTKLSNDEINDEITELPVKDLDEETKKVKFSDIDMVSGENGPQINRNSFELTPDYKELVVWKSSKEYILSHFNVAPPNPNLLSNIDEVWPEYILSPLLKASESVDKSVASLGNIMEIDDDIRLSPSQKSKETIEKAFSEVEFEFKTAELHSKILNLTVKDERSVTKTEANDVKKIDINILNETKINQDLQGDDDSVSPPLKQLTMSLLNEENVKEKLPKNENHQILKINGSKKEIVEDLPEKDKSMKQLSMVFPTDEKNTVKSRINEDLRISKPNVSNKMITREDPKQQSLKTLSINKELAPPQIILLQETTDILKTQTLPDNRNSKKNKSMKIDPEHRASTDNKYKNYSLREDFKTPESNKYARDKKAEKSFIINVNDDARYIESNESLRKWCMGLQNVTNNLELWTTWIENVCFNALYLKHEGMNNKSGLFKYNYMRKWIKLKENVDMDVHLWSQLRKRYNCGLQTYKYSHRTGKAITFQANKCNCCNSAQKKNIPPQVLFQNSSRSARM